MVILSVRVIKSLSGVACMLTLVAVATCGGIFGGPQGPSRRAGARGAEQICGEAGGNRRCNPGDGAEAERMKAELAGGSSAQQAIEGGTGQGQSQSQPQDTPRFDKQ